ncbi:bifunctional 3,4-dihydroxy-2-butanone-4-phosphate synthase/GTP cyclohydrolase II [candidate division KSB1 bacterium]|nr:bifunctional 3,4-dihydroxy-2-butanone-4-phosphate synthase/GTP cyclohydrolase II [candidate division KSB1 bacterium]
MSRWIFWASIFIVLFNPLRRLPAGSIRQSWRSGDINLKISSDKVSDSIFPSISSALQDLKAGKIVIVVDDQDRENEGDFILLAEKTTPEKINFMAKHGRGLICVPMTDKRLQELYIEPMVSQNSALLGTAFTVSVDLIKNVTTGISAHDRARTILALIDPASRPEDFARPGHIFPLAAAEGGVLRRAGHTEAVVDLARLAGAYPAGVLCEIMDDDGSMARLPRLQEIAAQFDLKIISVQDLIEYRRRTELLVRQYATANLPTRYGTFKLHVYESQVDDQHHVALVKGTIDPDKPVPVLVRVHSQCLTGDVFGSSRCDCGDQLAIAMQMIEREGCGVLLYMRQEGRGIGLPDKIRAYALQDNGRDTVEANEELGYQADLRNYGIGAQILFDLGVRQIRLMTNNPKKVVGLDGYGLSVTERVPIEVTPNSCNLNYLQTKRDKLGHLILLPETDNKK